MWATLTFLAACSLLDVVVNLRYPGKETRLWYLVPSIDILALLGLFALFHARRWRVPPGVHAALAVGLLLVRALRIGDGISTRFLRHPFSLYLNLSLLPELPRLLGETVSTLSLVLGVLGVVLGTVGAFLLTLGALRVVERGMAQPKNVKLIGAVTLLLGVASFVPRATPDERFTGAFASSGLVRLLREGVALVHAHGYRKRQERALADAHDRLARMPTNLSRLQGADVLLVIVESYGEALLEEAALNVRIRPEFAAFEAELGGRGYTLASSVLDSPTFGGSSWLAHAALNTGVRTENQLEYELLALRKPATLAQFFRAAGYSTVLVQPATARAAIIEHDYLAFERKYFAAAFDYRGPSLGWGTMPDQYVLDFVHRRELGERAARRPRFIEYALITSHAPWARQASVLDDWSAMGNGAVLKGLPIREHDTSWSHLDRAGDAYLAAVVYDLEVLRRYLRDQVKDDTLVIILGDHQAPGGVTGASNGHGVPVHVLSRRRSLVEPFVARGYTPGMTPARSGPRLGLETFLFSFLRDFSEDLRQTSTATRPASL